MFQKEVRQKSEEKENSGSKKYKESDINVKIK